MNTTQQEPNSNFQTNFFYSQFPQPQSSIINLKIANPKINKTSYYQKLTQRRPWTKEEDVKILAFVEKNGKGKWSQISSKLLNRSGKQIRERYLQILDPKIEKKKFTQEDDEKIISLVEMYGSKWKHISTFLSNRSDNQIKNRFYTHIKKKILLADKAKYGHILEKIQQDSVAEKEIPNIEQIQIKKENDVLLPSTGQSAFTKVEPKSHEESKEEIRAPMTPCDSLPKPEKPVYPFRPPVLLIYRNDALMQQGKSDNNPLSSKMQQNTPTTAQTVTNQSYGAQLMKAISIVSQLQNQVIQSNNQFYGYLNMCQKMFPSYDFKEMIHAQGYQQFWQNQIFGMSPRMPGNYNMQPLIQQAIYNNHQNENNIYQAQENQIKNQD